MKPYVLPAIVAAAVVFWFLSTRDKSSWIPTSTGAIHGDAYDFVSGHIGIHNGYKQDSVCKDYVNDLTASSQSGIGGAVEDAAYYSTLDYYYYKTEAYLDFHKDVGVPYRLELFKSSTYFHLPRVAPDKRTILDKFQDLSLATQMQMTSALVNEKGNPLQFTPAELVALIEKIVGKQQFDLSEWVIGNFFDQKQQTFMNCVPEINKLVENTYGPDQQAEMLRNLNSAEEEMQSTIRKLSRKGFFDW